MSGKLVPDPREQTKTYHRPHDNTLRALLRTRLENTTFRELADELGVSHPTIYRFLNGYGIKPAVRVRLEASLKYVPTVVVYVQGGEVTEVHSTNFDTYVIVVRDGESPTLPAGLQRVYKLDNKQE